MGRFSSWPLLASQAIDQPGQVSRLYLAGLAAGVEERPHALCGGRPSERFTEQLVLDPQTRHGVTDRGVDGALGRGDDVERE